MHGRGSNLEKEKEPIVRKRKTYELQLSKFELVHLRDLFSVLLATEAKQTVSQALADAEDRSLVEARLWQRVAAACSDAGIPMDEQAPDFVCAAIVQHPAVGVFRLSSEPGDEGDCDADEHPVSPFDARDNEEG